MIKKVLKSPVSVLVCLFIAFVLKFIFIDGVERKTIDENNAIQIADGENSSSFDGSKALAGEAEKKEEKVYDYDKLFPPVSEMLKEKSFGKEKAPVTIHIFSSFTCYHCANFFKEVVPEIMKNEVKEGKVRIIFEEYPTTGYAIKASMIVGCSNPENYLDVVGMAYKNASKLYNRGDFEKSMINETTGLTAEKIDACLNYEAYRETLKNQMVERSKSYKINATPTLVYRKFVNIYTEAGSVPYERVKKIVSMMLENKNPADEEKTGK